MARGWKKVRVSRVSGWQQAEGAHVVLALLEELRKTGSTVKEEAGRGVEVGSELGERGDITVLGEVELEGSSNGLHDLESGWGSVSGVRCGPARGAWKAWERTLVWAADPTRETDRKSVV